MLLYLPSQIHVCFPTGGEHVICCGSKLTNSQGQTKLTNFLWKQQHELSTCMWSGGAPWNHGIEGLGETKLTVSLSTSHWVFIVSQKLHVHIPPPPKGIYDLNPVPTLLNLASYLHKTPFLSEFPKTGRYGDYLEPHNGKFS